MGRGPSIEGRKTAEDARRGKLFTKLIREITDDMIVAGAPPAQVADVVYQAVLDNQFFVFPTRDLDAMIEGRLADIRQGMEWRDARFPATG